MICPRICSTLSAFDPAFTRPYTREERTTSGRTAEIGPHVITNNNKGFIHTLDCQEHKIKYTWKEEWLFWFRCAATLSSSLFFHCLCSWDGSRCGGKVRRTGKVLKRGKVFYSSIWVFRDSKSPVLWNPLTHWLWWCRRRLAGKGHEKQKHTLDVWHERECQ